MPLLQTQGAASVRSYGENLKTGPAVYIEDVFSTWLYTGTGYPYGIPNDIDLAGKGGMVWIKSRSATTNNFLFDTTRGALNEINSNTTDAQASLAASLTAFNTTGFSLGAAAGINVGGQTYASWTFREQPKFFDVVTYTGTGANRTIAHNLGSVPGCIFVKRTDAAADWQVYHRSTANLQYTVLNSTAAVAVGATRWNITTPTSTVFSLGTDTTVNASGGTYVAYIFAHDAGGFGNAGTDNVISCGSFTTDGSGASPFVSLGYEPQWILYKSLTATDSNQGAWQIVDSMRGLNSGPTVPNEPVLFPNNANVESAWPVISVSATGFQTTNQGFLAPSSTFIYIAIRRGPMKTPTSGTSVYFPFTDNVTNGTTYSFSSGGFTFNFDTIWVKQGRATTNNIYWTDRLRGASSGTGSYSLVPSSTAAESNATTMAYITGINSSFSVTFQQNITSVGFWGFKRAPGFFDVVCYTGGGSTLLTSNLGTAPELVFVKSRSTTSDWSVGYSVVSAGTLTLNYYSTLRLNTTAAQGTISYSTDYGSSPYPSVLAIPGNFNTGATTYVAYLFATVAGVSKVGSYTGTAATLTVNCGFTSGAQFVLIKRTDAVGDWYLWDSARGIVSLNDPHLSLNTTAAEVTTDDSIDTDSTGFIVNQLAATNINVTSATYIFLAIA
jgi:hypothetical protein